MQIRFNVRKARAADEPFLREMLFYASHASDEADARLEHVMRNPGLARYVDGWGRRGDLGCIAESSSGKEPLGAAWARLFTGTEKGYSAVDDATPEIAVAVRPEHIGRGIGTALLTRLIDLGRPRFAALALNVRADSPALRLYERLGFRIVGEMTNRVGGLSYDMRIELRGD